MGILQLHKITDALLHYNNPSHSMNHVLMND